MTACPALPTDPAHPLLANADCLDFLAALPEQSIDAFVDDPPAGIAFMGRAWDNLARYRPRTKRGMEIAAAFSSCPLPAKYRKRLRERITSTILQTCFEIQHDDGFAAFDAIGGVIGAQVMALRAVADEGLLEPWEAGFVAFMFEVSVAKLRVAKPGAHGLSWALPRTADLTMLALRLAGWEVRDVVTHLQAQGMPKSTDIGKALDKRAGARREVVGITSYGDGHVQRSTESIGFGGCEPESDTRHATAPATDLAKQWDGWGTGLAPSAEFWLLHRAPLDSITPERLRESTGWTHAWTPRLVKTPKQRRAASIEWPEHAVRMAADAEQHERDHAAWRREVDPARQAFERARSEWLALLPVPVFGADEDDGEDDGGPAEPEYVAAAREAVEALEQREPKAVAWSIYSGRSLVPGQPSRVELRRGDDAVDVRESPYSGALISTVEANVAVWGCGAINIDACRTATAQDDRELVESKVTQGGGLGRGTVYGDATDDPVYRMGAAGRWPKNATLGCSLACTKDTHTPWCWVAELDRQSGILKPSGQASAGKAVTSSAWSWDGCGLGGHSSSAGPGGVGGASRFFPTFRPTFGYIPKADDRTAGLLDTINDHPTIKSVEQMEWLVSLIAPPGGIVLDCFMGSGTTGIACVSLGVRFIGVEREAKHFDVAWHRIHAVIGSPEAAAKANAQAPAGSQLALL